MRHPRGVRRFCLFLFGAAFATALLFTSTSSPAVPDDDRATTAHWRDGELVPPLPVDPAARADAIRAAKSAGRARARSKATAVATPATGPAIEPVRGPFTGPARGETMGSRPPALPFRRPLRPADAPLAAPAAPGASQGEPVTVAVDLPQAVASGITAMTGGFDATDDTGWIPASPDIAVGTDRMLTVTNDVFAAYDKCGNRRNWGHVAAYFGLSTSYLWYDGRVIYDDWDGRWIMAYIGNDFTAKQTRIYFVISNSSNIDDGWSHSYIGVFAAANKFVDNLYIAVDPEGFYMTFNEFDFTTYASAGATVVALDKAAVYAGAAVTPMTYRPLTNPGDASAAFSIRPAQMNSWSGFMEFLNNKFGGGTLYTHWWMAGPSGVVLNNASVTTPAYSTPTTMRQPNGTYVTSGDCRITDLVYQSGVLTPVFTKYWNMSGTALSNIAVWTVDAATSTMGDAVSLGLSNAFVSYPSVDVDEQGHVGIAFNYASNNPGVFVSVGYMLWDWNAYAFVDLGGAASGLANYTLGGSGTPGSPYEWGNYTGCAIDPGDHRTFWGFAPYASDDPNPSWCTHVTSVSAVSSSHLAAFPADVFIGGLAGGPLTHDAVSVRLDNEGQTDANWSVSGVPSWLTVGLTSGQIGPAASSTVNLVPNGQAYLLDPGVYVATLDFENCTGTSSAACDVTLRVEAPIECAGAELALVPPVGDMNLVGVGGDFSLFITPMQDVEVCAIGLRLFDNGVAGVVACEVYEADGTTRGSLIAEQDHASVDVIDDACMVPMPMTLEACQDYEILFQRTPGLYHLSYDENDFDYPFDVGGVVRVRQSATDGNVADTKHPAVVIYGYCKVNPATAEKADVFTTNDVEVHTALAEDESRGVFATARDNIDVCAVGVQGDFVRGSWLTARVYAASGTVRGLQLAEGRTRVATGGLARHEVPVHTSLVAGEDYNITVLASGEAFVPCINAPDLSPPYGVDGVFDVNDGELDGAAVPDVPHLWLEWKSFGYRSFAFDLEKRPEGVPAPYTGSGTLDHGLFVKPAAGGEVYSLGVMADIPEGHVLTARIYRESIIGGRGALLSEGYIVSAGAGMRWHDVPLAATWTPIIGYDLSVTCSGTTAFPYWLDSTGMPYSAYGGAIQVNDAEIGGDKSGVGLVHLRVGTCNDVLTGVGEPAPRFVPFALDAAPNPATGTVELRYSVDAPATADLALYDVLGRHVADVFTRRTLEAGPGTATLDTSKLPSGVYFARLRTATRGVTRKIVVTR